MKNLTEVHHSFLHKNNWLTNHVARFVSHAGQFLCWNRAVFNCVQETCTRKNLYQVDQHNDQTTCTSFWYKFLKHVLPELGTDVTIIEIEIEIVFLTENRIESKSYFSCIPSNDLSIEALDRL